MPRIWLTRSAPFAAQAAAKLKADGYDVIIAPLLTIMPMDAPDLPADEAHLIFTSRHAVQILAAQTDRRGWPVICVGDASAAAARAAGFTQAISASGTAYDVIQWVQSHWTKTAIIRHISGVHHRGDIIETLSAAGYLNAKRSLFYESKAAASDPRLDPRPDDYVLLYSPRGAAALADLNLDMRDMCVISISAAIDAVLGEKTCKARYIAEKPTEASLFAHLP